MGDFFMGDFFIDCEALTLADRSDAFTTPEARGFRMLDEGSRSLPGDAGDRLERELAQCDALHAWLRGAASDAGGRA